MISAGVFLTTVWLSYMFLASCDVKAKRNLSQSWYLAYGVLTVLCGLATILLGIKYLFWS